MPHKNFTHVFFDCDSTLTKVESQDLLGELCGVGEEVKKLTELSMSGDVPIEEVWKKKIDLMHPTRDQVAQIAQHSTTMLTDGAQETVQKLQSLGKQIYVVSTGFREMIMPVAEKLGIAPEYVVTSDIYFNEDGTYKNINPDSLLCQTGGKATVVRSILKPGDHGVFIGDGSTDLAAKPAVDLFIGFGGMVQRELVKKNSEVYITDPSLLAVLPYIIDNS